MGTELNKDDYEIGFDGPGGDIMIVTIPLRKWSEDLRHGDILASGVFNKAERVALKNMNLMRNIKKQAGVIVPGNGTGKPPLEMA